MQRRLVPIEKTFKLTDEEFRKVEGLRRREGAMFCHYDVADIAKELGFYDRIWDWYKKECKDCNFSYWDDIPVYLYDKENKSFTFRGNKMELVDEPLIDGKYRYNGHGTLERVNV